MMDTLAALATTEVFSVVSVLTILRGASEKISRVHRMNRTMRDSLSFRNLRLRLKLTRTMALAVCRSLSRDLRPSLTSDRAPGQSKRIDDQRKQLRYGIRRDQKSELHLDDTSWHAQTECCRVRADYGAGVLPLYSTNLTIRSEQYYPTSYLTTGTADFHCSTMGRALAQDCDILSPLPDNDRASRQHRVGATRDR
jgi:hypothetical protein